MSKRLQVAVIIHSERAYHRKILRGIGAYMHEVGNWSLYIEDQPLHKLPDLDNWHGDGIILAFGIQSVIKTACRMRLPTVGIEGGSDRYDPASRIPNFRTDNVAIGRLGAKYLIERGFTRLAFCGFPSTGMNHWSAERAAAFQRVRGSMGCLVPSTRATSRPCENGSISSTN